MSELLKFYRNEPNASGYTLAQVLAWEDADWEQRHDFIQWVFPSDEPSRFNPAAEVLTHSVARALCAAHLPDFERALERFIIFLDADPARVNTLNHNLLRISRAIRSTALIAGTARATSLKEDLLRRVIRPERIAESIAYWEKNAR